MGRSVEVWEDPTVAHASSPRIHADHTFGMQATTVTEAHCAATYTAGVAGADPVRLAPSDPPAHPGHRTTLTSTPRYSIVRLLVCQLSIVVRFNRYRETPYADVVGGGSHRTEARKTRPHSDITNENVIRWKRQRHPLEHHHVQLEIHSSTDSWRNSWRNSPHPSTGSW
jgi:hypothetical protein